MKISAIRVAEFGRFQEPVALEGLSGGLDLLVGPNEAGKSTLVKALRFALFEKHRSNKSELANVRPYRGGAPLVEVDLEIGGERWRVRKRFLAERMAEVRSLSTGAVARGADAEAELERLLNLHRAASGVSLLWLDQGQTLDPDDPDEAGEGVLRAAITREVAASAGGNRARAARGRVREALEELVSSSRGQRRGRYLAMTRAAEAAASELAKARESYVQVEGLLDRLGRLDGFAAASDPRAQAAITERLAAAEDRLKTAHQDIAARDGARVAASEARAAHAAADAAARAFGEALKELDRLEAEGHADAAETVEVQAALTSAEARCEAATTALERARGAFDAAEAAVRIAEALDRRRGLEDRAERARDAAGRVRSLGEALAGLPLDAAPIREARRHAAAAAEAGLRLEAASSAVTVAYEPGVAPIIRVGDRIVGDGDRLLATEPMVLEIAGVGRITIEPGASVDRDRLSSELASHRASLARILAAAGVPDLAALERSHDEARRVAAELAEAQAELRAHAPEGLARLEEALAAAIAAAPDMDVAAVVGTATPDELRREVARLGLEVRSAEARRREDEVAREGLKRKEAVLSARRVQREQRAAEVGARLPPPELRSQRRAELDASANATSRSLDDALRILSAWEARAPDAAGLTRIEAEVGQARLELQRAEQQSASIAEERARIEGALEAARREDIASRLATLEAEDERARAAVADVEEEVAALRLLETELGAEEARLKDSFLSPVLARLGPYVDLVFPGATVALGAGYGVEGLLRGLEPEALDRLSDGTREQIAVLVRLAFAQLLAEQGLGVPLLLDDALVYSDDHRIAAMHRALEAAARTHQVIVLTCREQSFVGLRGERVALRPWRPGNG